jgi:hypothetical protein
VSDETGCPARSVGLSPLLLPLPHLPGASIYVVGIPLAIADPHLQSHKYLVNIQTPSKNIFVSLNTKIQKNEICKNFYLWRHRRLLVEAHIWVSSEIDPRIGIVIQSNDLSLPPEEKIIIVGCRPPYLPPVVS